MDSPHVNPIFNSIGVTITLRTPEDFLKVRETLTRIGIASKTGQQLFQSCHIFHKRGIYKIVHFKEMFLLDGKAATTAITHEDIGRRNTIANLLAEWGLVVLVDPAVSAQPTLPLSQIKVVAHKDKSSWTLVAKYTIGRKRVSDAENNQQ
jgi:hypothetical protein